jgi:hypothetical protein
VIESEIDMPDLENSPPPDEEFNAAEASIKGVTQGGTSTEWRTTASSSRFWEQVENSRINPRVAYQASLPPSCPEPNSEHQDRITPQAESEAPSRVPKATVAQDQREAIQAEIVQAEVVQAEVVHAEIVQAEVVSS